MIGRVFFSSLSLESNQIFSQTQEKLGSFELLLFCQLVMSDSLRPYGL